MPEIKLENKTVVDEKTEKPVSEMIWIPGKEEIILRNFLSKRFEQMSANRSSSGIEQKWDMADRLYTPHKARQNGNGQSIYTSSLTSKGNSSNTDDDNERESDISRPLAFEKIQTALALMIDQNPKAVLRSYLKKYEAIKEFIKSVYENNWDINRSLIELKAFIFNLAKYGNAFGRRYYKKTYRTDHQTDEQGNIKKSKIIDFDDVIFENLDPRQVYLDEKCSNARNARDGFIEYMFDYDDFFDSFDAKEYPNIHFVKAGIYLETKSQNSNEFKVGAFRKINTKEVQVLLYENRKRHEMHLLANGVLLTKVGNPLPYKHNKLSIISEKWSEKDPKHWEGIGICELLEMYQPLRDEIANASIDLVRQRLKPWMVIGQGYRISDESDDELKQGARVYVDGDINQVKWDRPEPETSAEINGKEKLDEEIDSVTGIFKTIMGQAEANTAYQDALNKESALKRLRLPLDNIKDALEDDARLAIPLFQQVYKNPIKVYPLVEEADIQAAKAVLEQDPNDSRFVPMEDGQMMRREFRQMDLRLTKDKEGQIIQSEEAEFWELVPENFVWDGIINIVPMSFLPISQQLELQNTLQKFNLTFNIPTVDMMGQPTLKDEKGNAYEINKVKLLKELYRSYNDNPDDYVIPITQQPQQQGQGGGGMNIGNNPIVNPKELKPSINETMGSPKQLNKIIV